MVKKKASYSHPLAAFLPDYKACREMSERVGCDPTHLLNIREGRRKPSVDLLVRLCDETGLPARAFVSEQK